MASTGLQALMTALDSSPISKVTMRDAPVTLADYADSGKTGYVDTVGVSTLVSGGLGALIGALGPKAKLVRSIGGALIGAGTDILGNTVQNALVDEGADPAMAYVANVATQMASGYGIGRIASRMLPSQAARLYDTMGEEAQRAQGRLALLNTPFKSMEGKDADYLLGQIKQGPPGWREKLAVRSDLFSAPTEILPKLGNYGNDMVSMMMDENILYRRTIAKYVGALEGIKKKYGLDGMDLDGRMFHGKGAVVGQDGGINYGNLARLEDQIGRKLSPSELGAAQEVRSLVNDFAGMLEGEGLHWIEQGKKIDFKKFNGNYYPLLEKADVRQARFDPDMALQDVVRERGLKGGEILQNIDSIDEALRKNKAVAARSMRSRVGDDPAEIERRVNWNAFENFNQYFREMGESYARFKAYGPNWQRLDQAAQLAVMRAMPDGSVRVDADVNNWMNRFLGEVKGVGYSETKMGAEMSRAVRNLVTITSMHFSALPNVTQNASTVAITGMRNFIKGLGAEKAGIVDKTGLLTARILDQRLLDMGMLSEGRLDRIAKGVLKYSGFNLTEIAINRTMANAAGWMMGEDLARKIVAGRALPSEIRYLREAGIDVNRVRQSGVMSEEDLARFAIWVEKKTQFGTRIHELPLAWRSPGMKVLTQYKQFAYSQAKLFKNIIYDAYKDYRLTGDIRSFDPLLRFGTLYPIMGAAVVEIRNFLMQNDVPESQRSALMDYAGALAGMGMSSDVMRSLATRSGFAEYVAGPGVSKLGKLMYYLGEGDVGKAVEKTAGPLPIAVSRAVFGR